MSSTSTNGENTTPDELLVVTVTKPISLERVLDLKEIIETQRASGVVILPRYCKAQVVPKDVKIEVREDLEIEDLKTENFDEKNG